MIVQILEPFGGGHHTYYIENLLRVLAPMREAGLLERVVVSTSKAHENSPAFQQQLSRFAPTVEFDTSVPDFDYPSATSRSVAQSLLRAVDRQRPDFVVSTTADKGGAFLAAGNLLRMGALRRVRASVGIFHYGRDGDKNGTRARVRDAAQSFGRRFAPWTQLLIVNPLLYEGLRAGRGGAGMNVGALPHPVDTSLFSPMSRETARRSLGIPLDGTYIGYVGAADDRKAIPELLRAFRSAQLRSMVRFLLAGELHPLYGALIDREFADLVRDGRLFVLDRYLSTADLHSGFSALDVAAVAYYPRPTLSASMLAAIGSGRPVLTDRTGYTGWAVTRFNLGWSCDILEHEALVQAIRQAVAECGDFDFSESAKRLIAYHHPDNYANTVLKPLFDLLGLEPAQMRTWEWVNQ